MSRNWTNPAMRRPGGWESRAACAADPDLMYADRATSAVKAAKQVCLSCPVRDACLTSAMAEEDGKSKENRHGIRGGLTPGQRYSRYRRQKQKAAA